MKSALLVLLIFCLSAFAQTGPDIQVPQTFIAATAGAAISNGGSTGAANFRLTFRPTGFTAATVQVETAEDCAGVACATWTAIASANVIQGSNPIVWAATDSPPTSQTMAFVFTHPWYRVNVTHVTGVGTISTLLLGYRGAANGGFAKGSGGGGGCTPGGPTNAVQLNGGSGTCTGSSALEFDAANGAFTVGFPGVTLNLEGTPIPFGVVSHSNDQRIGISAGTHSDAGAVPLMDFHFSRGSDQSQTTVQNGDQLGFTAWLGYDGTAYYPAALSASYVCDNPTSGNIPGCWDLSTATTSSGLNTAIHIDDNQNVQIPVELSTQSGAIADFSLSGNTIPARTGTGAPTGSNCLAVGEQFFQTDATAGQNLWLATTFGTPCTWTQITSGSGSSGSGITVYASPALTLAAGTYYFPVGGGSLNSATESVAQTAAPAAMTVANFYVQISTALGSGNSAVFTWRKGSSSQTLTCTISGASATSCNDITHSFTTAAGDLIDIQAVLTGSVIASFALVMTATTGNITPASPGFDTITTGTNSGQTLTVGAGSTLATGSTGVTDFSSGGSTVPARSHTGVPTGSNCLKVGEQYFQTDATAGQNLWLATTFGTPCTWTQISSGGGGGGGTAFITGQTLGSLRNNFTDRVGFAFTTTVTITIQALGRWVVSGNNQIHGLYIFDNGNGGSYRGVLAVTALDTSTATPGAYAYTNLNSPLTLPPGSYTCVSSETSGGDQWYDNNTTLTSTGVGSVTGSAIGGNPNGGATDSYVPTNFKYTL